jgi:crotonobetainyl-CoA:carnitine CoA-transferase CaiB-like acyl-CoA transferase
MILENIRVLDLSTLLSGPYCAMLLGDLGADVIKIEHPEIGDTGRSFLPFDKGFGALFISANRNKKSLTLNLFSEMGRDILFRLIDKTDVLIENFRPDIVEKLGLEYPSVSKRKPDIIYYSLTAFGEKGPYRMKPATDNIFQGLGGTMMLSGEENDPPVRLGFPPADMSAACYGAFAIMAALYSRNLTGKGQKIEISLLDCLIAFQGTRVTETLITGKAPERTGRASPFAAPACFLETKDAYINLSVFIDKFFARLCRILGLKDLIQDPRFATGNARVSNRDELHAIFGPLFKKERTSYWIELLEKEDIPCGPIYNCLEMLEDPQVKENAVKEIIEHPEGGPLSLLKFPIRFSENPKSKPSPPPTLGQHTEEILKGLGIAPKEIEKLRKDRTI